MSSETNRGQDWLRPAAPSEGLSRYIEVIRERRLLIVGALLLTLLGAITYLAVAPKSYEAQADLLVTPAAEADELLSSLGVLRDSSDPARSVETAARLVTSNDVAQRVVDQLDESLTATEILSKVSVEPVAQSSVVAITATGSTAEQAAARANAFAAAVVADRTEALHQQIDLILPGIRDTADDPSISDRTAENLNGDIARLEVLRQGKDPTIRIETRAVPPESPSWPRPLLTIVAAIVVGTLLGLLAAFAWQALDPRLRREEQLRSRYSLPILTRIPRQSSRRRQAPLSPDVLAPATAEAYRTLRASIDAARIERGGKEAVLVTGSSRSEGKTTTALNLSVALALAGNRVILVEGDLRRPVIAETLGLDPKQGLVSVLVGDERLEDALTTSSIIGPNLQLLLADVRGGWTADLFSMPSALRFIHEAKELADFVIVDSPPLTAVVDTLPLARAVDDVIVVTRFDVTRLDRLRELAELLKSNDVDPLGFAVVGGRVVDSGYYIENVPATSKERPDLSRSEMPA